MLGNDELAAYNVPSASSSTCCASSGDAPGVLTKSGSTPSLTRTARAVPMNGRASAKPIVRKMMFEGEEWLYFPAIAPSVGIIRASTADERGNLTFEHEGAYLGAMEIALAAHNNGGIVIAPGQAHCPERQPQAA